MMLALQDTENESIADLNELRARVRDLQIESKRKQAEQRNVHTRKPRRYSPSDLVLIPKPAFSTGESRKLEPRRRGPYEVEKVLPNDRYVLRDIAGAPRSQKPFHQVYSAEKLKPWITCADLEGADFSESEELE